MKAERAAQIVISEFEKIIAKKIAWTINIISNVHEYIVFDIYAYPRSTEYIIRMRCREFKSDACLKTVCLERIELYRFLRPVIYHRVRPELRCIVIRYGQLSSDSRDRLEKPWYTLQYEEPVSRLDSEISSHIIALAMYNHDLLYDEKFSKLLFAAVLLAGIK